MSPDQSPLRLRVLCLEDSPVDAELVSRALSSSGYAVEMSVAGGREEFELIAEHAQAAHEILRPIEFDAPIAEIVLQHHERLDGSGYPQGLSGDEIMPAARILAVADVVEAMSSHRPYRAALGIESALGEIRRNAGVTYDRDVAEACAQVFAEGFEFTD